MRGECGSGAVAFGGVENYEHAVGIIVAQGSVDIDGVLASGGYHGIVAPYASEGAGVCEECTVDGRPIHVGAECLVAVDVQPCEAFFTSALVAVEKLYGTRRQEQGGEAFRHACAVGVAVI